MKETLNETITMMEAQLRKDPGNSQASAVVESIAGGIAGALSSLFSHPLELIRTHQQTYINQNIAAGQPLKKSLSAFEVFGRVYEANSGPKVLAFYRGFTPNIVASSISWSAFFVLKQRCEQTISHVKLYMDPACPRDTQGQVKLSGSDYFISSVFSGGVIQIVINPCWVLKTRLMMTSTSAQRGSNTILAAVRALQAEGWKSFYKGMLISGVGVVQGGVQFVFYDSLKAWAKEKTFGAGKDTDNQPVLATWAFSTVSKVIPTTLTYPYMTIRSRLQVEKAPERFGVGIRGVSKALFLEGGLRAFYRGLPATLVRSMPSTWATFLAYEGIKPYLVKWLGGADNNPDGELRAL